MSVSRKSAEWQISTRCDTSWTFRSARPAAETKLPMLQLDYDVHADSADRVSAGRPFTFGITARHQDGVIGPHVNGMSAWASYDDGVTWSKVNVLVPIGNGSYQAVLLHPPLSRTNGFVTLRVKASDSAGNSVEQTIQHAYGLK
jgi:hypothetical protein